MKDGPTARSGFLAAGNFIIDQVKMIDVWPEQDALATISEISRSNGGGPYNVLKDLALLGAPFPLSAVGRVGDDANGQSILEDCGELGIDVQGMLVTPGVPTPFTDVMTVEGSGRRTFFYHPGANARFGEEDVVFAEEAKIFYLGYLLLLDRLDEVNEEGSSGAGRLLERASQAGHVTVVDLVSGARGRFPEVIPAALPHTDVLFLNEYEASCLLGRELGNRAADLTEAAEGVMAMGVRKMVVLHSPEGAVAVGRDGIRAVQASIALPVDQIRGAVGAGDAFAAGMLYGLHEGWGTARCLEVGSCVAAACLTDETTSGGVGLLEEALEMRERYGFRVF
jgi:sugar/nucleoside kinase (ribokinase family)